GSKLMMDLPRDTPITLRVLGGKWKAGGRPSERGGLLPSAVGWPPTNEWDRRGSSERAWVSSAPNTAGCFASPSATYAVSSPQRKLMRRRGREQGCGGSGGLVWPWCSGWRAR